MNARRKEEKHKLNDKLDKLMLGAIHKWSYHFWPIYPFSGNRPFAHIRAVSQWAVTNSCVNEYCILTSTRHGLVDNEYYTILIIQFINGSKITEKYVLWCWQEERRESSWLDFCSWVRGSGYLWTLFWEKLFWLYQVLVTSEKDFYFW